MDLTTVDIASLPWLPLEMKADFPRQPSIYFAIDSQNHVQYIGGTDNTRKRWKSHHRYQELNAIGGIRIAFLFLDEPEAVLIEAETALITRLNPPINKSPNLKGRRSKSLLETERNEIIARITDLRNEGDVLIGVRLDKAAAGGTASNQSQTSYKYARLRLGRSKPLSNGQKSQYIPLNQIAATEAAIQRGKELVRLQKRIEKLSKMLG